MSTTPFQSQVDRGRERQLKRDAVLRTAASLFCSRGYSATQMSDVAKTFLGVTKPTIYYYFENKEDVLVACFEVGLRADRIRRFAAKSGRSKDWC